MISSRSFLENLCDSKSANTNNIPLISHLHKDTTLTKIFVGGLPYHTTDESLKGFFESFGPIEEAVVITDRQSGKSRGYGFVTMANCEDAYRAISNPNPCIDGRKANVNLAILGAKPRILPGVSLNSMALSRLVPIQSLVPRIPSVYNNMMMTPPLLPTNLIGIPPNMSSPINVDTVRNQTPFINPIYNLLASSQIPATLRNNYPFLPYSLSSDASILQPLSQTNTVTTTPTNSQIYLAATQQYMSALNFQQQLNSVNPIASSVGLLNTTDASAAHINQSIQNFPIDPAFFA